MKNRAGAGSFKILPYFSVTSLLCIVVAAVLLTVLYREVSITSIIELGEGSNQLLARTTLNSVRPYLLDYLQSMTGRSAQEMRDDPVTTKLARAIREITEGTRVIRVKIYNRDGVTVFSTKRSQIGEDQRDNEGFVKAMNGRTASELVYRDTFNRLDAATEEDNLIQSYIPVRGESPFSIEGAFEIYTDVNPLVERTERAQIVVMVGAAITLLLLYSGLLFIVRRAQRIIEDQQATIRERTETAELLSRQLLMAREKEKTRIAAALDESIAHAQDAIKSHIEGLREDGADDRAINGSAALDTIMPVVHYAMQDVRAICMDLRPSRLDELGLVKALNSLCGEFQASHQDIGVEIRLNIEDGDVPGPLRIILYRIVHQALHHIARHRGPDVVRLTLERRGEALALSFEDQGGAPDAQPAEGALPSRVQRALDALRERTVLSGGEFTLDHNPLGGARFRASWSC